MINNRSDENTDKLTEEDFSLSDKLTLQEQKVIPSLCRAKKGSPIQYRNVTINYTLS